ncbi:MAG: hypothetical protein ACP6IU_00810 [Candidatus Asgardarchaeia archaeon]
MYIYVAYSDISKAILKTGLLKRVPESNIIKISDEDYDPLKFQESLKNMNMLLTVGELDKLDDLNRLWKIGAVSTRMNIKTIAFLLYNADEVNKLRDNDSFFANFRKMYNVIDLMGFINTNVLYKMFSQKRALIFLSNFVLRFIGSYARKSGAGLIISDALFFKDSNVVNLSTFNSTSKRYKTENLDKKMVNLGFWDYKSEEFTDAFVIITIDKRFKQETHEHIIKKIREMFKAKNMIWAIDYTKSESVEIHVIYGKKVNFTELTRILLK